MKIFIRLAALCVLLVIGSACWKSTREANVPATASNSNGSAAVVTSNTATNAAQANVDQPTAVESRTPLPPNVRAAPDTYPVLKAYADSGQSSWTDSEQYHHKIMLNGPDVMVFVSGNDIVRPVFYLVHPDGSVRAIRQEQKLVEQKFLPRLVAHAKTVTK